MSATRTDLEAALREALGAGPVGLDDVPRFLAVLADILAKHPDAVAALLPNYRLVKRSLTPAERATASLPAANRIRLGNLAIRSEVAVSTIAELRAAAPAISTEAIAALLNDRGVETITRTGRWTADRVRRLTKRTNHEA